MGGEASRRRRSPGEYAMMWQCGFSSCVHILFDSRSTDDAPEPQRLEPVRVQRREVDDRVGPDRDADERPAPPLVIGARRVRLLVLERLGLGDRLRGERVLLVDGDEGVLRAERVRAREAPLVAPRRGRLFLGREMVESRGVEAEHGPWRGTGRPRGPVCVFVTSRTLRMASHRGTQTKVSRARAPTAASPACRASACGRPGGQRRRPGPSGGLA